MNWRITVASLALVSACGIAYLHSPAEACEHPPKEFKYPIKAGAQRGLVLFSGGVQQLVIAPSYNLEGVPEAKIRNDAVEGFTSLAMVIPVPALPEKYAEGDAKLFEELDEFTKPQERMVPRKGHRGDDKLEDEQNDEDGVTFFESVKAGAYSIQPIKASGEKGGIELNAWLDQSGFGAIKEDLLKYYIDNKFYWLAVKLSAEKGLPVKGGLKPLHLTLSLEKPFYPLKIRAGQGEFDLELWVLCRDKLDLEKTKAFGLKTAEQRDNDFIQKNRETQISKLPAATRKLWDGFAEDKASPDVNCYRFYGEKLNKDGSLAKLEKDLTFEFKK